MGRLPNGPDAVRIAKRYKLHPIGERVALLASEQWGVLGLGDLTTLGLSRAAVGRWCDAGRLHRLHRGVYAVAPSAALAPQGRELAAVWACGDAAVLFSVSAAVRWGLLRFTPSEVQVLVEAAGTRPPRGVQLHRSRDLPRSDTTVRERIPITTVQRTVLDLAAERSISDRALESAAAQAERDGLLRRPAQLRVAARARHRTGAPRLRTILRVGPRLWRSDEEAQAAAAIVDAGLPEPVIAHMAQTDIGPLEVDLCFPGHRLILEVDGGQHALTLNAARDVDRDAALARAGWRTLRVTAADVRERPASVVAAVRAALSPPRSAAGTPESARR